MNAPNLQGTPEPLLRARGLSLRYPGRGSRRGRNQRDLQALGEVDLDLRAGQRLAVVGESGSGKSTLARVLLGLQRADSGTVHWRGRAVVPARAGGSPRRLRWYRQAVQLVPQDPSSSLNPTMSVGQIIAEPMICLGVGHLDAAARRARVADLLGQVGLDAECASRRPHEFSGGQRQRIAIARALAPDPQVVVADEPVTALDAVVRLQVLRLLHDLSSRRGLALVVICHDLGVVQFLCEDVLVLAAGCVVDAGPTARVFGSPDGAATRALLAAAPTTL